MRSSVVSPLAFAGFKIESVFGASGCLCKWLGVQR